MPYGRFDDFSPLSQADDQDARFDRLNGGDVFELWERYDETDCVPRMKLAGVGGNKAVILASGSVVAVPPETIVRRIAPRNVRIQVG